MSFKKFVLITLFSLCCIIPIQAATKSTPHKNPIVHIQIKSSTISTSDIFIELFEKEAPNTVANFLHYVESGFYNGTIFHRVIPNFMIQVGGFTPGMSPKNPTKPAIENEAKKSLSNLRGTLAMARTNDINSATSQFFINTKTNPHLDHKSTKAWEFGYAVFGKVIKGMPVVDMIQRIKTHAVTYYQDVPVNDIIIVSTTIKRASSSKKKDASKNGKK